MKVGILLHFDPTVKKINSELLFIPKLVEKLNPDLTVIIGAMSLRSVATIAKRFDLPYDVVEYDAPIVDELDVIITWNSTNMSNFFGGVIAGSFCNFYTLVSKHTNAGKPVLFRSGDSENDIYDYKDVVLERVEKSKNDNFYNANKDSIELLKATPTINYDKFYLLVNGERSKFHWVPDTYLHRKPMKYFTQKICDQALYLGDDLFFQVEDKYHSMSVMSFSQEFDDSHKTSLFWIGYIEHRNSGRKKALFDIFNKIENVSVVCHTSGSSFNIDGINWKDSGIIGDTISYFKYMSSFLAYVFVGKGTETCSYVNKTIYDCYIARLPILVYSKTDSTKMIFPDHPEFYFDDQVQLKILYQRLIDDPDFRSQMIEIQAQYIRNRLSKTESIKLDVI